MTIAARRALKSVSFSLLFLLGMKDCRKRRPADLHCAFRAELLTAEAPDAVGAGDFSLAVLYFYSLCRTDVAAYSAADTEVFF